MGGGAGGGPVARARYGCRALRWGSGGSVWQRLCAEKQRSAEQHCALCRCGQTYGRHSNSIDVNKKVCGDCKSRLVFLGK